MGFVSYQCVISSMVSIALSLQNVFMQIFYSSFPTACIHLCHCVCMHVIFVLYVVIWPEF